MESPLLAGHSANTSLLLTSASNPRVIYAAAKRVDSGSNKKRESEESPLLLTGGELRQAREVLSQNTNSVASTALPTTSVTPKSPLPGQPGLSPQSFGAQRSQVSAKPTQLGGMDSKNETGGDMEVANLLLNMGGSSSNDKNSPNEKTNKTSSPGVLSLLPPAAALNKLQSKTSSSDAPELEEEYLRKWVPGSVSLHTPEDDDVLSPLHCFMRRYCVEAFSAANEDVATPRYGKSHGFKVEVGQVGIRCLHCKHLPHGQRAERAVCYPSSLRNIYHSIETWQRRHSLVCKHITPWVRKSIMELMESSKTRAGGRRQYWEDSARYVAEKLSLQPELFSLIYLYLTSSYFRFQIFLLYRRLGMVDTSRGVRFARKPCDLGPLPVPLGYQLPGAPDVPGHQSKPVVRAADQGLVTNYLFLLMDQMQTCRFTEADRTGGRSKIKDNEVGFPGMECRHCQGRAGFGRYFPSSVAALSLANSDRNVYNHLKKCRRCPEHIKKDLIRLHKTQSQSKNRRGLRKIFFHRIWKRIHGTESDPESEKDTQENTTQDNTTTPTVAPTQQLPQVPQFVPYTGITSQVASSMLGIPYHSNIHSQVAVHKFRGY